MKTREWIKLSTALIVPILFFFALHVVRIHAQQAQPATAVQQTTTKLDSALVCLTNTASGTGVSWTPPGSQYVYVTQLDFESGQSTTGIAAAASPTTITLSNIAGTAPTFSMASGATTTPGTNTQTFSVVYPTGLKSQTPGTSVTLTLPTIPANTFMRVNGCAYYGY